MKTFKDMIKVFKEKQEMYGKPKPSAPSIQNINSSASASAPAPSSTSTYNSNTSTYNSNTSVSSYPTEPPPKYSLDKDQIEYIKRMREKKQEKDDEDYNSSVPKRIRKIMQIANLKEKKDGVATAYNLAKNFGTVERAMDFYKGVIWPIIEFYGFLGISTNKIVSYHIAGRTTDEIKAFLDRKLENFERDKQIPTISTPPMYDNEHDKSRFTSSYKPPHIVKQESVNSRWTNMRQNLKMGIMNRTGKRDRTGKLEDMSNLYDYNSSDESEASDYSDNSNGSSIINDDDNSIIKINTDGTHSRIRFNRSHNNNMMLKTRTPSPPNETIFGNLYGDEEKEETEHIPPYIKSNLRNGVVYEGDKYQMDRQKFMEEYIKNRIHKSDL